MKSVLLATLLQKSVREMSGADVVRLEKTVPGPEHDVLFVYVMVIDPCCVHLWL